jgi:hypothetical protein
MRVQAGCQRAFVDFLGRVVQQAYGRLEIDQLHLRAQGRGQGVLPLDAVHGRGNLAPQDRLRQAFAGGVHGRQAAGQWRARVDDFIGRVDHFRAKEAMLDFGPRPHAHALGQLAHLAAVKIHEAQVQVARFIGDGDDQLLARFVGDLVFRDDAFDLRHVAAAQAGFADRDDLRLVFVAHGQMQDQVHVGAQAKLGKLDFVGFWRCFGGRWRHIAGSDWAWKAALA